MNLSCFAAERKHRFTNRGGAFAHRHMVHTLLIRAARKGCKLMAEPERTTPFALQGQHPKALGPVELGCLVAQRLLPPIGAPRAVKGKQLKTPHDLFHVGDVIAYRGEDGCVGQGSVQSCIRVPTAADAVSFYTMVDQLRQEREWRYTERRFDDVGLVDDGHGAARKLCENISEKKKAIKIYTFILLLLLLLFFSCCSSLFSFSCNSSSSSAPCISFSLVSTDSSYSSVSDQYIPTLPRPPLPPLPLLFPIPLVLLLLFVFFLRLFRCQQE